MLETLGSMQKNLKSDILSEVNRINTNTFGDFQEHVDARFRTLEGENTVLRQELSQTRKELSELKKTISNIENHIGIMQKTECTNNMAAEFEWSADPDLSLLR